MATTTVNTASAATRTAWLRRHAAGERLLKAALVLYFSRQRDRIVAAVGKVDQLTPDAVDQLLDEAAERTKLAEAVGPVVFDLIAAGANDLWTSRPTTPGNKAFSISFKLPEWLKEAIEKTFQVILDAPWWADIQTGTKEAIVTTLTDGVDKGLSERNMTKAIVGTLDRIAKPRAQAIARTEVTGALNAGHDSAIVGLAKDGFTIQKEWLAILDGRVRESHSALNGVAVDASGKFNVGGFLAPYPGHHSLPAAERINCRCTTVAAFDESTLQ